MSFLTPEPLPGSKADRRNAGLNGHSDGSHLHSVADERAVLGCMMSDPERAVALAAEKLAVSDFFVEDYGKLFRILCEMSRDGEQIELRFVMQKMVAARMGDEKASLITLTELFESAAIVEHIPTYASRILDRAALRNLRQAGERIIQDVDAGPEDVHGAILAALEELQSVANRAAPEGVKKSRLTFRRVSELTGMDFDDSDRFMGERMLASGLNTVLAGPGGVGKSRLVMQMALCCITGRDFLSFPTMAKGKRWLIFQTENSNRRLSFDLRGMIKSFNPSPDEAAQIEENFIIHTIETDDDAMMQVENPDQFREMDNAIQDWQPAFVPFDPLNTFTFGDLNKDEAMREAASLISRLVKRGDPKRVPLILHHAITGKAGAAKAVGWDRSSFARNSKVLMAWARSQFNLAPRSADDNSLLLLSCGKCSEGREFDPIGVRFDAEKCLYLIDHDFSLEDFKEEVGSESQTATCTLETVARLTRDKPIKRCDLVKAILGETGISRAQAYRKVEQAEKKKLISENKFTFMLTSL